jgi:uncharacterized protein YbaR (Trm112 family)
MAYYCPVCDTKLKVNKTYDRGHKFSEKRICTHCGWLYYEQEGKVYEGGE